MAVKKTGKTLLRVGRKSLLTVNLYDMPTFTATLQLHGKTATGFDVPESVVQELDGGKRVPVKVTINGYTYRNTIAVYGGAYLLGVSAEHREGSNIRAGDLVEVTVERDKEPRTVNIPSQLLAALEEKDLVAAFRKLSYTSQKEAALAVSGAKRELTRTNRIIKIIEGLKP